MWPKFSLVLYLRETLGENLKQEMEESGEVNFINDNDNFYFF